MYLSKRCLGNLTKEEISMDKDRKLINDLAKDEAKHKSKADSL